MKLSCHGLFSSSIWAWVLSLRLGNIHFGHKLPIFSILSILRYLGEFDQKDLYRNCSQNLWLSQEYPKVQDGKHYFAICHSCELQDSAAANFIYCTLIFYFNFMLPFNAPRTHHPKHLERVEWENGDRQFNWTMSNPAYGRQGLDWIVSQGYSFGVFSMSRSCLP